MTEDDTIIAFLEEGDKELIEAEAKPKLEAVVSATRYTLAIPKADLEFLKEKRQWQHLEGVLYRRGCNSVSHDASEGILVFWISVGNANIDAVVQAIAEELDEITGRKMEEAGGDTWGMF